MMARRRKKGLTERQKRILEVLEEFQANSGYPPSIRDICDQANISSTSVVNYYLDQLKEMGYIERDSRVSRGIRLVRPLSEVMGVAGAATAKAKAAAASVSQTAEELGRAVGELLRIPVMGRIIAGEPVPVPSSDFNYFDAESWVEVANSQLPDRQKSQSDLFALEVEGESMIDAMVNDGDIVIMEPAQEASNGEMVAVWLTDKDETTLKYFYRENGHVRLQPANPQMSAIIVDDPSTVQVQGKVVMVIRQVKGLTS
jgi:repressor LexA